MEDVERRIYQVMESVNKSTDTSLFSPINTTHDCSLMSPELKTYHTNGKVSTADFMRVLASMEKMRQESVITPCSESSPNKPSRHLFSTTPQSDMRNGAQNDDTSSMFNGTEHEKGEEEEEEDQYFTFHERGSEDDSEPLQVDKEGIAAGGKVQSASVDISALDPPERHRINIMAENSLYEKTVKHVERVRANEERLSKKKTAEEGYTFRPKLYPYKPPPPLDHHDANNLHKGQSKEASHVEPCQDIPKKQETKPKGMKDKAIARTDGLFLNAAIREEKRAILKEKLFKEQCSFQPAITSRGHNSDHLRGFPFMMFHQAFNIRTDRQMADDNGINELQDTSFGQRQVRPISRLKAEDTSERLYRQAVYRDALLEMKQQYLEQEKLKECTFQPHLPKAGVVPAHSTPSPVNDREEKVDVETTSSKRDFPKHREQANKSRAIKENESSFIVRVHANQRLAENRLEEKKKKLEQEKMVPHTFQPNLATKEALKKRRKSTEAKTKKEKTISQNENVNVPQVELNSGKTEKDANSPLDDDKPDKSMPTSNICFSGTPVAVSKKANVAKQDTHIKLQEEPLEDDLNKLNTSVFERLHNGTVKKAQVIEKVTKVVEKENAKKFPFMPNVKKTALGHRSKDKVVIVTQDESNDQKMPSKHEIKKQKQSNVTTLNTSINNPILFSNADEDEFDKAQKIHFSQQPPPEQPHLKEEVKSSLTFVTSPKKLPVHHRLYLEASDIARKAFEAQQEKKAKELEGYTFEPTTNVKSSSVDKERGINGEEVGRSHKFNDEDKIALKKLREEVAKMRELEHCTFIPRVGRKPKKIVPGFKPSYARRVEGQGVRKDMIDGEYAFEDDARPVYERLNAQKVDYGKFERAKEAIELEKCTFKPTIIPLPLTPEESACSSDNSDEFSDSNDDDEEEVNEEEEGWHESMDDHGVDKTTNSGNEEGNEGEKEKRQKVGDINLKKSTKKQMNIVKRDTRRAGSVVDRLTREAEERKTRRQLREEMRNELIYSTCPFKPDLIGNKRREKEAKRKEAVKEQKEREKQEYILMKELDLNEMKEDILNNSFTNKYANRILRADANESLSSGHMLHSSDMKSGLSSQTSSYFDGKLDGLSGLGCEGRKKYSSRVIHAKQNETTELFDQWEKNIRARLDNLGVGV